MTVKKSIYSRRTKLLLYFIAALFFLYFGVGYLIRFAYVLMHVFEDFRFTIDRSGERVQILLWTEQSQQHPYIFQIDDLDSFYNSSFNASNPVKILVHGFSDMGDTAWTNTIKRAYLTRGKHNIIAVDWEDMAVSPWYHTAVRNSKRVGFEAAQFLKTIVDHYDLRWPDIHVLGASLGGHAAGYLGRFTEGRIGRITGLDPCGPLFHSVGPDDKLDSTDAEFVDVIHSAGRWVGNDEIQGHVDFFPNGGRAPQPECVESLDLSCSHFMSWRLFAESIIAGRHDNKFMAVECGSYYDFKAGYCCRIEDDPVEMGDDVSRDLRGTYFLDTSGRSPFALTTEESTRCKIFF